VIDAVGNPQTLLLGGTSEIALATAAAYAERRPLRVVVAARPSGRRDAARETLQDKGCTVDVVDFDARDTARHPATIAQCFAGGDVDVSLVAFGLLGDQEQAWTDADAAVTLAETNYVGAVSVGVLLAKHLKVQGHGSIVALSALSAVAAERPRRANFVYGSTKAGLDAFYTGLTEALRPSGVHVGVVRPGFVRSRMTVGMMPHHWPPPRRPSHWSFSMSCARRRSRRGHRHRCG
jgi:decaprenylphospho-beta-D-erythro-pentofuranosid-2-ulose 2-reductase